MPFQLVRNDITKMRVDAIVNAAKNSLLGGGGVDGAIHRAAGPGLLEECRGLGGCETGRAKITGGYNLPCKYVIHTVGPVWQGGCQGERALLCSCYRSSLELAAEHGCESVAFPLISAGIFGYPAEQALEAATETITAFLGDRDPEDHDLTVYLVLFGGSALAAGQSRFPGLAEYIDDRYVDRFHAQHPRNREEELSASYFGSVPDSAPPPAAHFSALQNAAAPKETKRRGILPSLRKQRADKQTILPAKAESRPAAREESYAEPLEKPQEDFSLEELLRQQDESFSQMLLRKIDERGMTDAQCYKRANIDRRLFSKIRSDVHYRPSKPTVLAFAVALELNLPETRELLMKAGFALSRSSKFDIIVEYFIRQGQYDVFVINEALFAYDQSLLGA